MTLVFRCRCPDEHHMYLEEMLEMAQKGGCMRRTRPIPACRASPSLTAASAPVKHGTQAAR
ncbi:Nitric oxide synthase, inducible [Plecturocebus cupreus]